MRVEVTARHVESPPTLRRFIERKLSRLERVLNDSAISAQVVLSRERQGCRVDITLHARGEKFMHGAGRSSAWTKSVGQAVDKIDQQAQTLKGKWKDHRRGEKRGAPRTPERPAAARPKTISLLQGPPTPRVFRASRQPLKSMSVRDAARELQAAGDGVVVFRDAETQMLGVLFKRANGELTLVPIDS